MASEIKVAILDMYLGVPNMGMKNITDILDNQIFPLDYKIFDVRGANEIPSLDYDIFISTGGPGSPLDTDGIWDKNYFELIDSIKAWNKKKSRKKFVLFICHSFQMICNYYNFGKLCKRNSSAFGIHPIHKTEDGKKDDILIKLPDIFHAVESRDWQIIEPNHEVFKSFGAKILCLEKIREHVNFERAVMAVRLTKEMIGTQFHPEADIISLYENFNKPERQKQIKEEHGEKKFLQTIENIRDPYKINLTYRVIIPAFLKYAISHILYLNTSNYGTSY